MLNYSKPKRMGVRPFTKALREGRVAPILNPKRDARRPDPIVVRSPLTGAKVLVCSEPTPVW